MYDFIFVFGSQGSGKTTLARILKEKLHSVHIDYDWIRDFHLDKDWKNVSPTEEQMSFENLLFLLKNYARHSYKNVIVGGFTEEGISSILDNLGDYKNIVISLYLNDDEVLKQRVMTETRDSGFRDYAQSIELNKRIRDVLHYPNEHKIDNTHQIPEETANQVMDILAGR